MTKAGAWPAIPDGAAGNWAPLAMLLLTGLLVNFSLVHYANLQGVLTAEEGALTFRNVLFLELHQRYGPFDTNLGGHLIFWLGSKLHPAMHLFYARDVKAVVMATAGPLVFLLARRLGLGMMASFLAGLMLILMPGFAAYSWLGIEAGMECLLGITVLLLTLDRPPPRWPLAAAILAFAVLVYPAALAFFPAFALLIARQYWRDRSGMTLAWALAGALAFLCVMSVPGFFWGEFRHSYGGGGQAGSTGIVYVTMKFFGDMMQRPRTYYFFTQYPAMGGILVLPLLLWGAWLSRRDPRRWWPIWLVGLTTFAIAYKAGGIPGFRRMLPLAVVGVLFLALTAQTLIAGHGAPWRRRAGAAAVALVVLLFAGQTARNAMAMRDGELTLPRDLPWPAGLSQQNPAGDPADIRARVLALENPTRAMCILAMLTAGRPHPVFTPEEILEYYRTKDAENFGLQRFERGKI
jgi:hypothetical protein